MNIRPDKECPMHGGKDNFNPRNAQMALAIGIHDDAVQLYRFSLRDETEKAFNDWITVLESKIAHYQEHHSRS